METIVRKQPIIPLTPAADHRGKEGHFVVLTAGNAAISATSASDIPLGVIIDGENTDGKDSVLLCDGGAQTVRVKLGAAATAGTYGTLHATDGTVCDDPGSGARVRVCRFLEDGSADELVEAVLITPTVLS